MRPNTCLCPISQLLIAELIFLHLLCSVCTSLSYHFLRLVISLKCCSGSTEVSTLCYYSLSQRTRPSLLEMPVFSPVHWLQPWRTDRADWKTSCSHQQLVSIQHCGVRDRDFCLCMQSIWYMTNYLGNAAELHCLQSAKIHYEGLADFLPYLLGI